MDLKNDVRLFVSDTEYEKSFEGHCAAVAKKVSTLASSHGAALHARHESFILWLFGI